MGLWDRKHCDVSAWRRWSLGSEWAKKCPQYSHVGTHRHTARRTHTLTGAQTQTCFNSSTQSTRGLCVRGWEMPRQHALQRSLEGRKKLNSIKMSVWWKMHGGERGTVAPCTQLSTEKAACESSSPSLYLVSSHSAASLSDHTHLLTKKKKKQMQSSLQTVHAHLYSLNNSMQPHRIKTKTACSINSTLLICSVLKARSRKGDTGLCYIYYAWLLQLSVSGFGPTVCSVPTTGSKCGCWPANLLTSKRKRKHFTPVLRSLRWLLILCRTDPKLLLLAFLNAVNGLAASYLSE